MVLPTHPQNINSASPDAATLISSYLYKKLPITLLSTSFRSDLPPLCLLNLFKSDLPLFDHEKMDKKPVSKFLQQGVYCHIGIKNSLLKQANLCKYTQEVIAYIVIIDKRCLDPDIWPDTLNKNISIEDVIFSTQFKEAMKQKEINFQQ